MKRIFTAIILCISLSANAEVFKCVDAEGKTTYQNTPCPNDKGDFIDLDKNTKMSVEEYKKKKEQEEERIKQELEAAKQRKAQETKSSSTYSTPSSTYTPSYTPSYSSGSKSVNVRGYTRKDGTYVRPYTRSSPRR